MTTTVTSSSHHPQISFKGSFPPKGEIKKTPVVERAITQEVRNTQRAGLYGERGQTVVEALNTLIWTA